MRASRVCAGLGARVAVAEPGRFGGTCVNVGCIPKKLFSYAAHFREDFEVAAAYGWSVGEPRFDWKTLVEACSSADIVVSDRWLPSACTPRWLKLDRQSLGRTGGIAVYLSGSPRVQTVAERLGRHPWALTDK